jgi:hypothetical protein
MGILPDTRATYTATVGRATPVRQSLTRWIAVMMMSVLAMLGVPAILSALRPKRTRDEGRVVLVVGQDLRRIG